MSTSIETRVRLEEINSELRITRVTVRNLETRLAALYSLVGDLQARLTASELMACRCDINGNLISGR